MCLFALSGINQFNQGSKLYTKMKITKEDQKLYDRIRLMASIPPQNNLKYSQEDLYTICQYSNYSVIASQTGLLNKLVSYSHPETGNTCLHVAAIAGNKDLVVGLVENKKIDANAVNSSKQTALMSVLKHNDEEKAEKIAAFLMKSTDVTKRDAEGNRAHQLLQATMNKNRARILENLKKMAAGK